jgi:hypothetical protein
MSNNGTTPYPTRTAVIVVHGMGSQRPTETTRGLVEAAWLEKDAPQPGDKRFWLHPERTGDLDLLVFTSNNLFPADSGKQRTFHFHEFYWAHLMSETKAVAVLLWLFELARRGPRLGPRLRWVWWGGATFLAGLVLSLSFLALHLTERLSGNLENERHAMIFAPFLLVALALLFAVIVARYEKTAHFAKLATNALLFVVVAAGVIILVGILIQKFHLPRQLCSIPFFQTAPYTLMSAIATLVTIVLPLSVSVVAARVLMGPHGVLPIIFVYVGSWLGFALYFAYHLFAHGSDAAIGLLCNREVPWSLDSRLSAITAWTILGLYLAINAAFLQPYLGDAARYFRVSPANIAGQRQIRREAVQLLEDLHLSGEYDRIIVVAHSLGTVVAYDMLHAYFSRICGQLPATAEELQYNITAIERDPLEPDKLRRHGREIVRSLAQLASERAAKASSEEERRKEWAKAWLVTDFITLGSPLCHAVYLTSQGDEFRSVRQSGFSEPKPLELKFKQRVSERQYPTCPPQRTDGDERLTFLHTRTNTRRFHHGALFGLTRWTNLYFPMSELLWGDAVGGEVAPIFGNGVIDVKVYTHEPPGDDEWFTHVRYWDIGPDKRRDLPHIRLLRRAINLEDKKAITREQATDARHEADRVEVASTMDTSEAPPS